MEQKEALSMLSDGHSMWEVEAAKEACAALDLWSGDLPITTWQGQEDANPDHNPKGLFLDKDEPGEGVNSLELSRYVAQEFGVAEQARQFFGRGTQAREYAKLVRQHLKDEGKLEDDNI